MQLTPSLKQLLDQDLEKQCRVAGAIMRKNFKKSLTVTKKPDGSRVTNVDLAIAEWIVKLLPQYATELDLFSEETARRPISQEKPVLIVDELDGTSHYIAKRNGFAHQTALWWPGEGLVCGMIYYPLEDILLKAWRGEKAQMLVQGVVHTMETAVPSTWADFRHYHTKRYRGSKYRVLFSQIGVQEDQLVYTHADRTRQALKGDLHSILSLMRYIHPWDW
ncbi:MAG: inositol monophosphatase family protein, partial [Bacteroidota bacterium]